MQLGSRGIRKVDVSWSQSRLSGGRLGLVCNLAHNLFGLLRRSQRSGRELKCIGSVLALCVFAVLGRVTACVWPLSTDVPRLSDCLSHSL